MIFNRNFSLCILILLGFLYNLKAQEYSTIENVTFDTELQNHNITSIAQDSNGFLWIGTNLGLYRYDGYHFIPYNVNTTPSLLNNNIKTLLIDNDQLWVGSKGGINILNTKTKTIINLESNDNIDHSLANNYITRIIKDEKNNIWVGYNSNKISKYIGGESFENFDLTNLSSTCKVNDILEISEDNLLIEIIDGNPLVKKIVLAKVKNNHLVQKTIFEGPTQTQIVFKRVSNIYLAQKNKIYKYDILSENFKLQTSLNKSITKFHGLAYIDDENKVYLGSQLSSFYSLKNENTKIVSETFIEKENVWINCFFIDNTGLLWVGSTNGLFKLKKGHSLFSRYLYNEKGLNTDKMRSIIQDHTGTIYAVSQKALYKFNKEQKQFINKNWIDQIDTAPYAMIEHDSKNFLVGTQGSGIAIYNKETNSYKPFLKINKTLPSNTHVSKLFKDIDSNIWIGTSEGLLYYNEKTGKTRRVLDEKFTSDFLINDFIFDIKPYNDNELWIASSTGLYHVLKDSTEKKLVAKISKINDIPHAIRSILLINNTLWLATQGSGLIKYNIKTNETSIIDESKGLANNTAYALLPGAKNELWVGTLNGLSRYDTISKQILGFYDYDGLAGNEFNSSSQLKTKEGMVFFGGQNGISSFTPNKFEVKKTNLNLNITSIKWFNSIKDTIYYAEIENGNLKPIEIPHSNSFVNFEFSLSDYFKPENNTFKYRFIGLHSDWRVLKKTNILSFTNLPPGDYQLEVMAATNYGIWNEQSISLPIKVSQIFYKRWWFLTSLGLLFLLFLYSMRRYELYHIKKLEKLRLRISRDLHDELGSSLTGIAIRSELIREKVDSKEKDDFLNEIAVQSRGAVDILSDIVWAIDSRNNSLQNVADRMHDVLFLLLSPLDITFSFKTVESKNPIYLNQDHRRHVFLIFKEAITNITKHSNATHVDVSITKDKYNLKLIIKDNGTLISKSENTLNGNGIKNMKLRAEKIDAKFQIYNEDGFTIELLFDYLY